MIWACGVADACTCSLARCASMLRAAWRLRAARARSSFSASATLTCRVHTQVPNAVGT